MSGFGWSGAARDDQWVGPHRVTGLEPDLTVWEDHTWVLHACYRNPELAQFGTADELHRALLAEGLVEPDMVGDVSLDDLCQATGVVIGWSPVPGPDWHRVRWAEFADLAAPQQYPPSCQWCTAYNDADFEGLNEGSMDEATWKALAAVLAAFLPHGAQSHVFAQHCSMVASYLGRNDYSPVVRRGPLANADARIYPPVEDGFLPNNIWAPDLSWITWTDYDLSGTVVAGPKELVDAVRAHPDLETCQWLRAE